MATRKQREALDPHGVRDSTHTASQFYADHPQAAPVWTSATALDLIRRLDEAKAPAPFDAAAVRSMCRRVLSKVLRTNAGYVATRMVDEATTPEIIGYVTRTRAVAAGTPEPMVGRPGWQSCTACGHPVHPAALVGSRKTVHPMCDAEAIGVPPPSPPLKSSPSCRVCRRWLEGEWPTADDAGRAEIERQMAAGRCDDCTRRATLKVVP